jgi:hypothetical protein
MFTFSDELYSDLYKDARGFRPGQSGFDYWESLTAEEKQVQWDNLVSELNQRFKEEQQEQKLAIARLEAQVEAWIKIGAGDRETAIRWLHEAEETDGDNDYLCYKLGLPYGYLNKE